jgi:hypothetical protein
VIGLKWPPLALWSTWQANHFREMLGIDAVAAKADDRLGS